MKKLVLALWLVGCGSSTKSSTQPGSPLAGVPQPAAAALQKEAGTATIVSVDHDSEGGVELYEGKWIVDGLSHEVTVKADGTVVEREDQVPADQVPEPVRTSAVAALPGAQNVVYVKMSNGNYEAEATIDGKERDVLLTPAGAVVPEVEQAGQADDKD